HRDWCAHEEYKARKMRERKKHRRDTVADVCPSHRLGRMPWLFEQSECVCVFVCVILSGVCVGRVFLLGMCISVYVSVRACWVWAGLSRSIVVFSAGSCLFVHHLL